jgi:signal transduction histidine kinase/HPt (histidine-containing phosphotransfer) domain-containing protein
MTYSILIVDDEADNLRILSSLLKEDYQVYVAKSGEQALNLTKSKLPDLILLDVVMPHLSGFEVIKKLKDSPDTEHIPVIFITGLGSSKDEATGFELGATDYIHKPFNPAIVQARVSSQMKIIQQRNELQQLSNKLQKASEAKGMFLANMSHEIRTPLTTVIGYTESLMSGVIEESDQAKTLAIINNSSNHLLSLVNNILDFSKIEAGEISIEWLNTELDTLLQAVHVMCNELAKKKGLTLEWHLFSPIPKSLITDPTRLKQILINIISNAIKFTDEGTIKILLGTSNGKLNIAVEDQGIGIAKEKMNTLFTSFNQVDNSTSRKFGGTGLGLSISQSLAHKLNGEINVKSTLGLGSTFTLSLQIKPSKSEQMIDKLSLTSAYYQEPSIASKFKAKALLAEDHEENRQLITLILRTFGLEVDAVQDGKQAVQACMDNHYDLVFMDIQMPVMTGMEAQKLIRNCGLNMPIIALTANVMKEEVESYLEAGFDDHLAKPIDTRQLQLKLETYCASSEVAEEASEISSQILEDLRAKFQKSFDDYKDKLEDALKNENYKELGQLAHKFNGAARSFNFQQEGAIAEALEKHIYQSYSNIHKTTLALIDKLDTHTYNKEK